MPSLTPVRSPARARARGLTLLEILISIAILAMIGVLIYGAFDGLSRSKQGLSRVNERYHTGRATMRRLAMELSSAYLSAHIPYSPALIARQTVFISKDSSPADRLDMNTFSHRRVVANSKESDQNELSYFGSPDPAKSGKIDLARRESAMLDTDATKGGIVYVLAEDIDLFDLKFLDPTTSLWLDTWDSTQATGQAMRLPLQVRITLALKGGPSGKIIRFEEKVPLLMIQPLSFAIPR
jgi:general secretion pathway protein J